MVLDRYIFKEVLKSQIVVLVLLLVILAGQLGVKLMSSAASGEIPPHFVGLFLLYSIPNFLIFLLPLTLYVAIILTLGRVCSDSEMVVMRSVGYSPTRVMRVVIILALFTSSVVSYVGISLIPKASVAQYELEQKAVNNPEFLPIDSGRFVDFGKYTIYVEDVASESDEDKSVHNIFVMENSDRVLTQSVSVAEKGYMYMDEDGVRWLTLNNGKRYEFNIDDSVYRAQFENFKTPISSQVSYEKQQNSSISRLSTWELLQSENLREQVEAQWRISPFLTTLVLCMIAVPLSMVNPRQGRFARLMPAILIYVAYYMIVLSVRNLLISGELPLYPGIYLVPVLFFVFVAIPLNLPKGYSRHFSLMNWFYRHIVPKLTKLKHSQK